MRLVAHVVAFIVEIAGEKDYVCVNPFLDIIYHGVEKSSHFGLKLSTVDKITMSNPHGG